MNSGAFRVGTISAMVVSWWLIGSAQSGHSFSRAAFLKQLATAAAARDGLPVRYVNEYVKIRYPGGDVPADTGVCTDEVIRSYRALGIDLQREVHEDMVRNLSAYPTNWGAKHTDTNVDHRRVPNLMVFFTRNGERLRVTKSEADYLPGDIVTWELLRGTSHIGIVVARRAGVTGRYQLLHNIGYGPRVEDVLFAWKITGHYRYYGTNR